MVSRIGEPVGERVGEVWDALWRRGQIRIYPSEAERTQALAQLAADAIHAGDRRRDGGVLMMADTREQAAALNGAIRDRLVAAGPRRRHPRGRHRRRGTARGRGPGRDPAQRPRPRRDATATPGPSPPSAPTAASPCGGRRATDLRTLPAGYAREHVELAYATTVYGAQGETTSTGHLMLGEHTSAASAYVAMTRGRDDNIAHLVADDEARRPPPVGAGVRPGPGRPRPRSRRRAGRRGHRALRHPATHPTSRGGPRRPVDGLDPAGRPPRATPTPGRRTRRPPAGRRDPRPLHARPRPPPRRRGRRQAQLAPGTPAGRRPRRRPQRPRPADLQTRVWATWHQELAQARARRRGRP